MRPRLTLAISLSILLIVIAFWYRPKTVVVTQGEFINQVQNNKDNEEALLEYLRSFSSTSTPSGTNDTTLSTTNMVGRQLFLDFFDMSTRGEATEENLLSLADIYTDNLVNLSNYEEIGLFDLVIVPNTKDNLMKYGEAISVMYFKYQALLDREVAAGSSIDFSSINSSSKKFASRLSEIYSQEASELKSTPAPKDLAQIHLKLVNNYLARSAYYLAISEVEKDPALAFAAIVSQGKNLEEADALHWEIIDALTAYGI